jgi:NADPH:quinone reductase-like Zn-dependent oxidoreductase
MIRAFGSPDVLTYTDVATPAPGPAEVRVRVLACGINHYDIFLRRGAVHADLAMPHVMGADVIGEIDAVGPDVNTLEVGQRVMVAPGYPMSPAEYDITPINMARSYLVTGARAWGGYAEYMVAPARFVHPDSTGLPPQESATLPLVLTTAVHATRTLAAVSKGHKVLVQAGASGSGAMCVQVARILGAEVATTVGDDSKVDFARRMGATLVINYRRDRFHDAVKEWSGGEGVDAVIDNVGGDVFDDNIRVLRRGGHFVNFGMVGGHSAAYNFPLVFYKQLHLHGSMMGTPDELAWGLDHVRDGHIQPILDRTMPLSDAGKAHEDIEARRVQGKIVLIP